MADLANAPAPPPISRQRIDHIDRPDGSVETVLTITLPGGVTQRYSTITTPDEAVAISGDYIGAELLELGYVSGNIFKKIAKTVKKGVKAVGKVTKAVASSKVFALAAKGLAIAAPALGPLAGPALAVSAGMGVASKLTKASVAAAAGAKNIAKQLTASAASDAKRLTKTAEGAASLLADANRKRLGAAAVVNGAAPKAIKPKFAPRLKAKPKPAPKPAAAAKPAAPLALNLPTNVRFVPNKPKQPKQPKPAAARASSSPPAQASSSPAPALPPGLTQAEYDLLQRARAGRVRSNTNAAVSDQQLLAAHRAGRIFWVH